MNLIEPKDLAAYLGPILDEVVDRVVREVSSTLVPALAARLDQLTNAAMAQLNDVVQNALKNAVVDVQGALIPALERVLDGAIDRLDGSSVTVAFKLPPHKPV